MTPRQSELLEFIKTYISENNCSPSCQEMADALGTTSKGHIQIMIKVLIKQGKIKRLSGGSRTIEIIEPAPKGYEEAVLAKLDYIAYLLETVLQRNAA